LFLAIREEHRSKVFENRVLRRIFVLKEDAIIGENYSDELYGL
jgi:hypothetical protein